MYLMKFLGCRWCCFLIRSGVSDSCNLHKKACIKDQCKLPRWKSNFDWRTEPQQHPKNCIQILPYLNKFCIQSRI